MSRLATRRFATVLIAASVIIPDSRLVLAAPIAAAGGHCAKALLRAVQSGLWREEVLSTKLLNELSGLVEKGDLARLRALLRGKAGESATIAVIRDPASNRITAAALLRSDRFGTRARLLGVEKNSEAQQAVQELLSARANFAEVRLDHFRLLPKDQQRVLPFPIARQVSPMGSVRKATEAEIKGAVSAGKIPDDADVAWGVFVDSADKTGTPRVMVGSPQIKRWNQATKFTELEETLSKGKVVSAQNMRDFMSAEGRVPRGNSGGVQIVEYDNGIRGVFKPDKTGVDADAEVAAYLFSEASEMHIVPPTVHRTLGNEKGSVQFFVDTANDFKRDKELEKRVFAQLTPKEKSDKELFYFIMGNWDRHTGNQIIDNAGALALIDNAEIRTPQYARYGEVPFVGFYDSKPVTEAAKRAAAAEPKTFPFDSAKIFRRPTLADVKPFIKGEFDEVDLGLRLPWYKESKGHVGVVEWKGKIWLQIYHPPWYEPSVTNVYSRKTLENLKKLDYPALRKLFPSTIPDDVIRGMVNRRDQVLEAAKKGELID